MSLLTNQLLPASFRGVPFEVDASGHGTGRRAQVHEYPQRDKPWAEDLGRATREIRVTAFVAGEDYLDQHNALLGALEQGGPGELIHPWLGTLQVSVLQVNVNYDRRGLGVIAFDLAFVEAGELTFPAPESSTEDETREAADGLADATATDFAAQFLTEGYPDFVRDQAAAQLGKCIDGISIGAPGSLSILGYADQAAGVLSQALGYLDQPARLAGGIMSWLGVAQLELTGLSWRGVIAGLVGAWALDVFADTGEPSTATPSRKQADINTRAQRALMRRALLAQAVGASSLIPAVVHDDVLAVRALLVGALDAEALTAPDAVYRALITARGRVWADLTARARGAARLRNVTPGEPLPALVLAHRLYADASREAEIIARNRIANPLFVPAVPLKVLAK